MSDSLQPYGMQRARLPCPLLSPGVCSNSCPLSQWCYLTFSSPATPFSFYFQYFPATGSFLMSQLFWFTTRYDLLRLIILARRVIRKSTTLLLLPFHLYYQWENWNYATEVTFYKDVKPDFIVQTVPYITK